jgi:hypothetical protein
MRQTNGAAKLSATFVPSNPTHFVIVNPVASFAINTRDITITCAYVSQITTGTVRQSHTLRRHDLLSYYRLSSIYDRMLTQVRQWDCFSLAQALTFSRQR